MEQFIPFLESLRTKDNTSLIDAISSGYHEVYFEGLHHYLPIKFSSEYLVFLKELSMLTKQFDTLIKMLSQMHIVDVEYLIKTIKIVLDNLKVNLKLNNINPTVIKNVNTLFIYIHSAIYHFDELDSALAKRIQGQAYLIQDNVESFFERYQKYSDSLPVTSMSINPHYH